MLQAFAHDKRRSLLRSVTPRPKSRVPGPPIPAFSNQLLLRTLQQKPDCACGGQRADRKPKAESFYGDLNDGIEKLAPDIASLSRVTGDPEVVPMDKDAGKKEKAPDCGDICDRAYKDDTLNTGGGGVVCDGATKCACVFDVPPLKRGQCPDFDRVVLTHETHHVTENNSECDPKGGLHRAKVKDDSKLEATECKHRKESIKELDAVIPKNKGDCKTGMQAIRDLLDTWVKANC
jgi:hypothetical protein